MITDEDLARWSCASVMKKSALREAVPALLAEVKRLRKENARLRSR